MKKIILILPLLMSLLLACDIISTGYDERWKGAISPTPAAIETGFAAATNPGDTGTIIAGSQTVDMNYANNSATDIIFPTGTGDAGTATINRKFFMGKTTVTNALFAAVLQWAKDNGKFSTTVTDHNRLDATTAKYGAQELIDLDYNTTYMKIIYNTGTGKFSVESGFENYPVVLVSWYGAIMFCNWLTEMRDVNTNNLVYTNIPTNGTWNTSNNYNSYDDSKTGYRLPSSEEWEYAARYRGTDSTNTVSGYISPYFTKGNSLSGATTYYNDTTGAPNYAGKLANDLVAVYGYYYDGSWQLTGVTSVAAVGSKAANALGLYDMSGNVTQWCFTTSGSNRVFRGGAWHNAASNQQVGYSPGSSSPSNMTEGGGFRFARTQ